MSSPSLIQRLICQLICRLICRLIQRSRKCLIDPVLNQQPLKERPIRYLLLLQAILI
jgi:hypothetical protein